MSFTLPYPTSPTNGDALNADPIRANLQAIASGIQSFDGSQVQAGTVSEAALATSINPRLRASETFVNWVQSGCVWTQSSGLIGSMTGGVIYQNGYRTSVSSVGSKTFTASKDTYIDIDYLGNVTYAEVANSATSPALTANSQRIAKIVTNGSAISSIVQNTFDSIGNVIYNTNPSGFNTVSFPTYSNSWVDYDTGTYSPVFYAKDKTGTVIMGGLMKNGTAINTTAFTLPVGYRPAKNIIFASISAGVFGRLDITSAGAVIPVTGSTSDFSLSVVAFKAMQ